MIKKITFLITIDKISENLRSLVSQEIRELVNIDAIAVVDEDKFVIIRKKKRKRKNKDQCSTTNKKIKLKKINALL